MYNLLVVLVALASAIACGWLYWMVQRAQLRMAEKEAEMREKVALVGELADELVMASQYLYEAMDDCLAQIEASQRNRAPEPDASAPEGLSAGVLFARLDEQANADLASEQAPMPGEEPHQEEDATAPQEDFDPHFQALALAAQGMDLVEIARHTGIGVEELHLLLRFQDELNSVR